MQGPRELLRKCTGAQKPGASVPPMNAISSPEDATAWKFFPEEISISVPDGRDSHALYRSLMQRHDRMRTQHLE